MYGFLFIKKGNIVFGISGYDLVIVIHAKCGFAFVKFFLKMSLRNGFPRMHLFTCLKNIFGIPQAATGLYEDVCSHSTYVTTATMFFFFFFYKQFVLPRTKLIWIFSSYRICQIRNIQLQDNTFQSISFINMADSMKIILTLLALMCLIN